MLFPGVGDTDTDCHICCSALVNSYSMKNSSEANEVLGRRLQIYHLTVRVDINGNLSYSRERKPVKESEHM